MATADTSFPYGSEKQAAPHVAGDRPPSPVAAGRMSTESAAAAKKILEHSGDHDEAMKAFASGEVIEVDDATNKRLLKRIDMFMMPLMCVGMS
jgi:MFS transporter, ACS family, allantoate permease